MDRMGDERLNYIESLCDYMMRNTNLSYDGAWAFAFRCWQMKDKEEFKSLVFGDKQNEKK